MSTVWKTIRVFLSSTFRDMHAERDHLIKVTFPALRERLLPYRVELYDIDLRWGITEDEAKNEQVISLCLEQIDECRPFFLSFLGHRYGWVPESVPDATRKKYPFVDRHPGVSVTEMELQHGAMLDPTGQHSLILLRSETALRSIPEDIRSRDFTETVPMLREQLEVLKHRLQASRLSVQPYSAEWDPQRVDRVNRTQGRLHGLDDFGSKVEDWLWKAIKKELKLPETPAAIEPLDAEADLHERFLEQRTRIYFGRNALYRQLSDFALVNGDSPLLLSGESGLGKSAALARFVRDFRKQHTGIFVLPHFVGASSKTTSLPTMLQRLILEIKRRFALTLPKAESTEEIIRAFLIAITIVPPDQRVVLVFDALNQLDADSRAESLIWLPEKLPHNVRVICSSVTDSHQPPRILSAFGDRDYVNLPLTPLTDGERREIVRALPKLVAKTLADQQIEALLANPATRNPLFLIVALEELRGYGSFERLNQMIAELPREGDALRNLFEQVFDRLEQEFNQPLVDWTLRLLACSRRGLSGPELVALTQHLGDDADDLYPVLRQLRQYLQVRDGFFDFYHTSIRLAAEKRYLQWTDETQQDPWLRWSQQNKVLGRKLSEQEIEARNHLVGMWNQEPRLTRAIYELPWQTAHLKKWNSLIGVLTDKYVFFEMWTKSSDEVCAYWILTTMWHECSPLNAYQPMIDSVESSGVDGHIVYSLSVLLWRIGYTAEAMTLLDRMSHIFECDASTIAGSLNLKAAILEETGELQAAMKNYRNLEELAKNWDEERLLCQSIVGQALISRRLGAFVEAESLLQQAEKLARSLNDQNMIAHAIYNRSGLLYLRGAMTESRQLLLSAEAIWHQNGNLLSLSRCMIDQAVFFSDAGFSDESISHLRGAEAKLRLISCTDDLARCLRLQAGLFRKCGDLESAQRLQREALGIAKRGRLDGEHYSALIELSHIQEELGDLKGALRDAKLAEEICRASGYQSGQAAACHRQANVLREMWQNTSALKQLRKCEQIYRASGNRVSLVSVLTDIATVEFVMNRNVSTAKSVLLEQEALCRDLEDAFGLQVCLGSLGGVLLKEGRVEEAQQKIAEQESLCRRMNYPRGVAIALANRGHILAFRLGNTSEAFALIQEAYQIAKSCSSSKLSEMIWWKLVFCRVYCWARLASPAVLLKEIRRMFTPDKMQ